MPLPFSELAEIVPTEAGVVRAAIGAVDSVQATARRATAGTANHAVFMGPPGWKEAAGNGSSFRLPHGAHNQYLSINTKRSRARDRTYTGFTRDVNSTLQYEIGPT